MSASALPYEVRNQVLSKPIVHPVEKTQARIEGLSKMTVPLPELIA
jgi:hypothetical protein